MEEKHHPKLIEGTVYVDSAILERDNLGGDFPIQ